METIKLKAKITIEFEYQELLDLYESSFPEKVIEFEKQNAQHDFITFIDCRKDEICRNGLVKVEIEEVKP